MLPLLTVLIAAQIASPPTDLVPVQAPTPSATALLEAHPKDPSVYRIRPALDIPITLVGAGVAAVRYFATDAIVRKSCPCDPSTLNRLDRETYRYNNAVLQPVAHVTLGLILAVPIILDAIDLGFSKPFFEDLMVLLETLSIDTAFQAGTALIVQRPRPLTYAGHPEILEKGEGYVSFYAGHVATAFAASAVVAQTLRLRYGHRFWPWLIPAAAGTAMALMRVYSGDHFPTDVLVGAAAGLAVGIAVPWLHARTPEAEVRIVPAQGGAGVAGKF